MWENFVTETRERVTTVTIQRPPLNTLSVSALMELGEILDTLEKDEETRVILLTGDGDRAFSAGADISEFGQLEGGPRAAIQRAHDLFRRIESFPKPVIAVLNGRALGGGNELQMACHLAFASDQARIGLPEVKLGIIPGYGGTQRLPRLIGKRKALQLLLSGEEMQAEEAKACGLVNEVFPHDQLREAAFERAAQLARLSAPLAMEGILRSVDRGMEGSIENGLEQEAEEMLRVASSEDAAEGIQAFFTKQEPAFKGR
ncbi:MAG: enoyl-CoA hydratase-related protein [Firmicutes bacterium]|uniref:Enoyl-CoA hydratase n=1 Tax=Melghirimyces thermohalophilus TaxID=1236220 RepID=A0A1G6JEI2_9BACL|nr:enoyl-CoA hydratase-related protein [Melghirimyces thermohalophilus]MDA8351836.1 enoyl-CoA hydratase-related protein [Bacillota bacterium]SDC17099.1 enoyl-CoA hydratase [Melghirimyces thermohalophilus]